jgi:hypothetical protein
MEFSIKQRPHAVIRDAQLIADFHVSRHAGIEERVEALLDWANSRQLGSSTFGRA